MLATSSDTAADAKAGRHAMDSVPFDALRHTINIYYEPFLLNGQNCNIMNSKMSHGDKCTMTWLQPAIARLWLIMQSPSHRLARDSQRLAGT
jgi:hypothetical protein